MKNRLMIANRDLDWLDVNQIFLSKLGYVVETCTDGLECLANLRFDAPALLVLDLDLPWGGGDGVLAWLREERAAPRIPVLLMGPAEAGSDRYLFNEWPVVEFLPKPVGLIRLLDSIRAAFESQQRADPSDLNRAHGTQSVTSDEKVY